MHPRQIPCLTGEGGVGEGKGERGGVGKEGKKKKKKKLFFSK